ncbi:hypothetical protein JQ625_28265 [Bradyrhizobium diazoefficiens]|nr:hypothetical protein [Bradyrhizobium diazoefficiens]MBR0778740.1 hypothetical protein [Bradyrhizobium diazoefficiens]
MMSQIDQAALERAITITRAESPARASQIDAMLKDRHRENVGLFCVGCAQSRSLNLDPWQSPPMYATAADLKRPYGDPSGRRELAELLQRMRDAGLSRFEPDPLRALEWTERLRNSGSKQNAEKGAPLPRAF